MISLAPAGWWRGLGNLTRSGSSVEGLAWALYDFANTVYSFAIVSFAMGLWAVHFLGEAQGQLWFTVTVSASVAVNAAVSPVLGAMSDRTGGRKVYLFAFTALCIVATALIAVAGIGVGLLFFGIANFAYQAALIYYDAMIPDVARPGMRGRLSGVGVALGYLGTIVSGILLTRFGTSADGDPTPATFLLVASLFTLFAIPIFVRVPDRSPGSGRFRARDVLQSWTQLAETIRHAREVPGLLRFVVGRFFYSDPVNTAIAVMSVFATEAVGFKSGEALVVILLLTIIAVIASFGWGVLNDRIGPKRTLMIVLATWGIGLVLITVTLSRIPFLLAGALLGAGLGGVGVTDRLLLLRLAPPAQVGEMLGLYGLAGKFSAVIGPLVYGLIVGTLLDVLGHSAYQLAIGSLLVLLVIGAWIVRSVPEGSPEVDPAATESAEITEPAIVPPGEVPR
jgi:UMF1 family MFS transporter